MYVTTLTSFTRKNLIKSSVCFQFFIKSLNIKLSVLPSKVGGKAVTLHEAVMEKPGFIFEIAMDSDYTLFFFSGHDSENSEIQIWSTSTFLVLNTIVLEFRIPLHYFMYSSNYCAPYDFSNQSNLVFHYHNGLIAIGVKETIMNMKAKWIRFIIFYFIIFQTRLFFFFF